MAILEKCLTHIELIELAYPISHDTCTSEDELKKDVNE